jgi:hypothetical protein
VYDCVEQVPEAQLLKDLFVVVPSDHIQRTVEVAEGKATVTVTEGSQVKFWLAGLPSWVPPPPVQVIVALTVAVSKVSDPVPFDSWIGCVTDGGV